MTYTVAQDGGERQVFRIEARQDAIAENISLALDNLSPVASYMYTQLNCSSDGAWLVVNTNRFDPGRTDWSCLALVKGDLSSGEAVTAGSNLIHPEGSSDVSSNGTFIVFTGNDGNQIRDLFAISRANINSDWGVPINLTSSSTFGYNQFPSISADGSTVLFSCGNNSYGEASICEVANDGTGFQVVVTAAIAAEIS